MRKLSLVVVVLSLSMGMSAKSMTEIWKAVPDSVIPYIDANHRLEMTEFMGMGLKGEVDNALQGKSTMDTLTANYIHLTLSESMTMEIKRMPYQQGDSILCVVRTWTTPQAESAVNFYDQNWQPLQQLGNIGGINGKPWGDYAYCRPDSMADSTFHKLVENIDFVMTAAYLSSENNDLTVKRSAPLTPAIDQSKLEAILCPVTMKWDGMAFR